MQTKTARNASLDLLKCISMLMVVALHATNTEMGLLNMSFAPPGDIKWIFSFVVRSFAFVAVDCFVLITGYFMCKAKFSYKKVIKLWITVFTYSFGLYCILCLLPFVSISFSLKDFITYFFPVSYKKYWFVTSYITLYILTPFINKFISNCTKAEHRTVLIVFTGLFILLPTAFGDRLETNGGYSTCWFIVLYLSAAYIRIYGLPKLHYGRIYFCLVTIAFLSVLVTELTDNAIIDSFFGHFLNYNSIVIYPAAVCLFMFFLNKNIPGEKPAAKAIIKISSLSFGVYLFHEHNCIRPIIWNEIVDLSRYQNSTVKFILIMTASVFIIFIIGIVIEWVRSSLYKLVEPFIFKITDRIKETLEPKFRELINK